MGTKDMDHEFDFEDPLGAEAEPVRPEAGQAIAEMSGTEFRELLAQRDREKDMGGPIDDTTYGRLSDEDFQRLLTARETERNGNTDALEDNGEFDLYFRRVREAQKAGWPEGVKNAYALGDMDYETAATLAEAQRDEPAAAEAEPEGSWINSLSDDEFAVLMDPERREVLKRSALSAAEFRTKAAGILGGEE